MIQLNEATHVYTLGDRRVPSVTQALSVITKGFEFVDPDVLEAARRFGNHVHIAIALFNDGELKESTLDPALARYLHQYKQFLHDTGFKPTESERIVYHSSIRYAGKFDIKGEHKRTTWLLDLKSGGVPMTVGPQCAAYQRAHPEPPKRRAVLQLKADRYVYRVLEDERDWHTFVSALNCYRFLNPRLEIPHGEEKAGDRADRRWNKETGWP